MRETRGFTAPVPARQRHLPTASAYGAAMSNDGAWLYLYLLLEFQSRSDRWLALRLMNYAGLLWQDLVRSKRRWSGRGRAGNAVASRLVLELMIPGQDVPRTETLEETETMLAEQEGRLEGERAIVQRLLTRRFGPLSKAALARLAAADAGALGVWTERLLDATTLDEVF